ncbi:hypothetical protein ACQ4PT_025337 [Festuca glaucescens]
MNFTSRKSAPSSDKSYSVDAVTAQHQDGSAEEGEEQRLRAALRHLQAEAGVLERLVYKHRNQHRGAAYFQYLIKVRRDLKLLLSSNLAEVINAAFPVIACRKPANTILVPNRHGKKKPGSNHSHYKRLLGVARLLSQMLIDVVLVYNKVTDLTDRKQAVKITIDKVQAFREYYPSSNDPSTILECVWVKDKFVLHERNKASSQKTQDENHKSCALDSSIQYETLGPVTEGWNTLPSLIHAYKNILSSLLHFLQCMYMAAY